MFGRQNGCDLGNLEKGPISKMFINPEVLASAVWAVYQDRLQAAGVENQESFYDAMTSDMVRRVESAMKKAIADFFPWGPQVIAEMEKRIQRLTQTIAETETSGESSGSVPESSESIQGP